MGIFELIIALLLTGAALTVLAQRMGAPYPALLALAGAGLALVPRTPTLVLDPELALTLFVAPVLMDSAFDASLRDLRANWRSVAGLALGAVVFTVVTVAFLARLLVPQMPWAVAIALGAIVAPVDASAATAVLKQLRPPNRLLVIWRARVSSTTRARSSSTVSRSAWRSPVRCPQPAPSPGSSWSPWGAWGWGSWSGG